MCRGGGNCDVELDQQPRSTSRARPTFRNPTFNSSLSGNYAQPLLRGFKIDATRASLQTNASASSNDEITLQSTIADDDGQRAQRLLGPGLRDPGGRSGAELARHLEQAGARTTRRASRSAPWRRSTSTSAQAEAANRRLTLVQAQATVRTVGARAEAADRQRHRRSAVGLVDQSGRSAGRHARADQRRRRGHARAAGAHRPAAVDEQPEDQRHQPAATRSTRRGRS